METDFIRPTRTHTDRGFERRVGVEIEYSHVGLRETAHLVRELFGGHIEETNRFAFKVVSTRFGDFEIDSDSSYINGRKWHKYVELLGVTSYAGTIDDLVQKATDEFVPYEITTPPIPLCHLDSIEELRSRLQKAGALGTYAHFFTAFGMQFNPEMPDLSLETMLAYMRAYFLKIDWLMAHEDIPMSRRVLPFIDPFPQDYVDLVLDPAYAPSLNGFMRDYLEFSPTRNRSLDWLPLFAYLNKALVFEYPIEKELVKPRPTLHYRLPSSLIDDPSWSLASEWNKWVTVENLAADREALFAMLHEAAL